MTFMGSFAIMQGREALVERSSHTPVCSTFISSQILDEGEYKVVRSISGEACGGYTVPVAGAKAVNKREPALSSSAMFCGPMSD
jgi:hypothetical protein